MIKYIPLLSLFFVFFMVKNEVYTQDLIERTQQQITQQSNRTEPNELAKLVAQNQQSTARFNEFNPFEVNETTNSFGEGYALGSVQLDIKEDQLNAFIREKPATTTLKIPVDKKSFFELELFKVDLFAENFIYRASDGRDLTTLNHGVFYRGIIKGDNNSIASASIFGQEIRIMIGDNDGNYVIGKLKDGPSHVLYNDRKLLLEAPPGCVVGDAQDLGKDKLQTQVESTARNSMAKCVPIYVECDYDMFKKHNNSEASVIAFVSALVNETATIYANEQVAISLSDVKVWTTTDPYASLSSTSAVLQRFGQLTKNNYNGRLAHFISTRRLGGGVAWLDVLCSSYFLSSGYHVGPYAVSASMGTSITTFPTYSWNVEVFAHEMGHNMGSPHTQNCSWNGNNTAIDACSYTEGGCPSTYGACPPGGGTIMSYCHLTNCGIDFNNGFGAQPGALIRNRYNNAACALTCATPTCEDGVQNGNEEGVDCGGSSCTPCPCFENQVTLSITLDIYPAETSWTLKNSTGNTLYTGGNYNQIGATINQTLNLPPASGYQFTINDGFGDGICCSYGNGSFSLKDNQGEIIASGGAFGASFSTTFCTQSGGPVDNCPNDPNKTTAGLCGCGVPDTDSDNDNTPDCDDNCPNDPNKVAPGSCGCGVPDTDTNNNGTPDCKEASLCPENNIITSNSLSQTTFNAQKNLITTGSVIINNEMTFKAGQSVLLKSGFHAVKGSNFKAMIENCTSVGNNLNEEETQSRKNESTTLPQPSTLNLKVMPNPFRGTTKLQYSLSAAMPVLIQVMDVNGRVVQLITDGVTQPAGIHEVYLNGDDLLPGMYYVFLVTPKKMISEKVILMR